ncbi:glycoside hydrolase domain-containing protein [Streptomyces sp. NPDC057681]|uniref:glycoside hydrolase domain-containing protein n=1 Tax=Streptomyces sp. NPDC057681 TaxID=3346209 RepID=UPI0036BEB2BD
MHRTRHGHRRQLVVGLVLLLMALTALPASAGAEPGLPQPSPTPDARLDADARPNTDPLAAHPDADADADADPDPDSLAGADPDPLAGLALPDLATIPGSVRGDFAPDGRASSPAGDPEAPGADGGPSSGPLLPALSDPRMFRGRAFDTCMAPSLDTMRRWRSSKYGAVGVYYGGRGRACRHQPRLGHRWMKGVQRLGWRVLPVYVGSQSPCVVEGPKQTYRIGRHAWRQGVREGRDAVRRARAVGIRPGSPLYLDMEAYKYRQKKCARTTLTFVRGWDRQVRLKGYMPGFYSSADSGVAHMRAAARAGARDLPSVIWFARWHTRPRLAREPVLRGSAWSSRRRIHQYAGNVKERHGGRTLVIDRNLVHAPVARIR